MGNNKTIQIDARGLSCPQPVLLTKEALSANSGCSFEVIVDNGAAKENVTRFAKNAGYAVALNEAAGDYYLILSKK